MGVSSRRRTTRSFVIQLLVLLQALLGIAESESAGGGHPGLTGSTSNGRCEEITIPMCTSIGYNLTAMPNELNHATQEEARLDVHQYLPLVQIKCSPDLKFFLCSMYTPKCLPEYTKPLPACRSVCERARAGCAPVIEQFGFLWPERLACERLPNHGDPESPCMEVNPRSVEATGSSGSGGGHPALTGSTSNGRCEKITIPMCTSIGYNLTAMPNELNHATQEEAHLEIHQFLPLVRLGCSPDLKFFLCSMYTPKCLPKYTKLLPACRSVCERVRAGCTQLMQRFGFWWPESLACERLPNHGDPENPCMEQDNHTSSAPVPAPPRPTKSSIPTQTPRYTSQQAALRQAETSKVVIERITELCRRLTAEEVLKAEFTEGQNVEVSSVKKEEEDEKSGMNRKMEALRKEVEELKKEAKETRRLVEKIGEYLEDKKSDETGAEGLTPRSSRIGGEAEKVEKLIISEEGKERNKN